MRTGSLATDRQDRIDITSAVRTQRPQNISLRLSQARKALPTLAEAANDARHTRRTSVCGEVALAINDPDGHRRGRPIIGVPPLVSGCTNSHLKRRSHQPLSPPSYGACRVEPGGGF